MASQGNLFQIRFGVAKHDVSVVTAVSSLLGIAEIIKEVGYATGREKIDVSIRAPQPGSVVFDIVLVLLASDPNQILTNTQNVLDIGKTLLDILTVAKQTGGERPKTSSVETKGNKTITTVLSQKGNTYIFNGDVHVAANLLGNNSGVQRNMKTIGEAGKKDDELKSLSVILDSEEVEVQQDDFDSLEKIADDVDVNEIVDACAPLTIIRPSFDQKLKSDFYYRGNKIACWIQDAGFYKEIDAGKKFAKGDTLECNLVIKQKFQADVNTYVNNLYVITKVLKHMPRGEQMQLL